MSPLGPSGHHFRFDYLHVPIMSCSAGAVAGWGEVRAERRRPGHVVRTAKRPAHFDLVREPLVLLMAGGVVEDGSVLDLSTLTAG